MWGKNYMEEALSESNWLDNERCSIAIQRRSYSWTHNCCKNVQTLNDINCIVLMAKGGLCHEHWRKIDWYNLWKSELTLDVDNGINVWWKIYLIKNIVNFLGKERQMKQKCTWKQTCNCCDYKNKLIFTLISFWCEVVAMVAIFNLGFSLEILC